MFGLLTVSIIVSVMKITESDRVEIQHPTY